MIAPWSTACGSGPDSASGANPSSLIVTNRATVGLDLAAAPGPHNVAVRQMHLRKVVIENFRQLEYIEETFCSGINVIVGRNGVGKSNILQAIRLAKAILAPRTQNESTQTLISLSAMSPHNQQMVIFDALAGDATKSIKIECHYGLSKDEIDNLEENSQIIAVDIVRQKLGQMNASSMAGYFSSLDGQQEISRTLNPL